MLKTVAQSLLDLLQKNGVKNIYGVTGDTIFPLFDVLSEYDQLKFIGTIHETSAAFMASYQAKLTGEIGICVATSGPGIANLTNGLADAYFDQAPVLAITGQVSQNKIGTKAKQYLNQQTLLKSITYSSEMVASTETLIPIVSEAIENALSKKTVTHVSIPEDLFGQQINKNIPILDNRNYVKKVSGFSGQFEEAVSLLQEANQPLIIIGVKDKQLKEYLENLAERTGAAIIISQQAKGIIPDKHSRVIGGIGEAYVPAIIEDVDLILQIGSASYEKKFLPEGKKTIQIVKNQGNIDYDRAEVIIKGDVMNILKELLENINPAVNEQWEEKIGSEKEQLNNLINEEYNRSTVTPGYLMTVLSEKVAEDAIIVCDIGAFTHWFDTYFQASRQTILLSSNWRSMGSALPGAISASLSNDNEKQVIVLTGDGGLLVSLNELATAVKYQLPVTIIVANNNIYEIEKLKMENKNFKPFGIDMRVPDFAELAKSFGAQGLISEEPEKPGLLIEESLNIDKPVVLDVKIEEAQLPFIK